MNEPIRRRLPDGVSFAVTERFQGAPTAINITVSRANFGRIGFCVAAVVDHLVITATRRVLDLIRTNPGIIEQVGQLVQAAGDEVVIPMRLHRHVARGNRVFAITVLSQVVMFDDDTVTPESPPTPNLPAQAVPQCH